MSGSQPEVFSPHNIAVLGGLLLLAVFIGEVLIGPHKDGEMATMAAVDTMEEMAMRLKPVVSMADMKNNPMGASGGAVADLSPKEMYDKACMACHASGAAGAPKLGDAAAWADRLAKGLDALTASAVNGIGAMPPRGGSQFSDEQIGAIVEYILDNSK